MTPSEKTEKKKLISREIELGSSRLRDNEVEFLYQFVTQYDRFIGITETIESTHGGSSSDGKYTRRKEYTYSYEENRIDICVEESYHDYDGQSGEYPELIIDKARDVINWFRDHKHRRAFDGVRDICNLI